MKGQILLNNKELAISEAKRAKVPNGIFYGELKRDTYWEALRQDPRYDKLLAELAPRD